MATRRRRGEDGISFEHRGPCSDPHRHRHCPGLWRGELTLGYTGDGKRQRRKVSGTTKVAVVDKLRDLRTQLDTGITPKAGYAHYTLRRAAEDWLAHGLEGRSPKTVIKNQNVLEPILAVIGARKLRDLTAADVRQALAAMAAGYSTAAVSMGHLALKRAIRHAEASDLVSRNVATLADTPKGQEGRPSKSLTLEQALAVITAARTLPVMELRPGLKDVRRPAELMHAYITLSLLCGLRTEEARALRWAHVDLDGDPAARPPVPPHVAVWRSVASARRDQDRTVPPHPRPPLSSSPGAARLGGQPGRRAASGGPGLAGHRAGVHHPQRRRAGRGERPQDVQTHLHRSRNRGQLDPARAAHLLRQLDEPPRRRHRGDRPPGRPRHHPHHRDRLPPRTTTRHHHRRRGHGLALHDNLARAGPRTAEDPHTPAAGPRIPGLPAHMQRPPSRADRILRNATIRRSPPVQIAEYSRRRGTSCRCHLLLRSSGYACPSSHNLRWRAEGYGRGMRTPCARADSH